MYGETEKELKTPMVLKMESMIENIKLYQNDF